MTPLPTLDATRCTGCGDCVAACPADCLELAGRLVWLPRPADCIACGVCADVCPTLAIHFDGPALDSVGPRGAS